MAWRTTLAQAVGGRELQEDSANSAFDASGEYGYAIVADGLGGHAGGEVASATACAAAAAVWERESAAPDCIDPVAFIAEVAALGHQRVATLNSETGTDAKTTMCCAFFARGRVFVGNVGDSRIYLSHGRGLQRLSRDHTVVEMLRASGQITEDQMRGHPDANRLTQALGSEEAVRPFIATSEVVARGDDAILLCSDGLWQALSASRITHLLVGQNGTARTLVDAAVAAAGPHSDNVTALVVRRDAGPLDRLAGLLHLR